MSPLNVGIAAKMVSGASDTLPMPRERFHGAGSIDVHGSKQLLKLGCVFLGGKR